MRKFLNFLNGLFAWSTIALFFFSLAALLTCCMYNCMGSLHDYSLPYTCVMIGSVMLMWICDWLSIAISKYRKKKWPPSAEEQKAQDKKDEMYKDDIEFLKANKTMTLFLVMVMFEAINIGFYLVQWVAHFFFPNLTYVPGHISVLITSIILLVAFLLAFIFYGVHIIREMHKDDIINDTDNNDDVNNIPGAPTAFA